LKQGIKDNVSEDIWNAITWNKPYLVDPPLANDLENMGLVSLRNALRNSCPTFEYIGLQFGCDASKIQPAGIPTVVFGPGSIREAHTADEWILADDLLKAIDMYSIIFQKFELE